MLGCSEAPLKKGYRISHFPKNGIDRADLHRMHHLGCDFVRPVRFTKDGRLPLHRLRTFFFFGAKLVFAQKLVLLCLYTNIHYKMTIFYLCIGFVEVKNTDTHLYIRQTNNLFVYTDAKKDAKISLYFAYLGLLSAPQPGETAGGDSRRGGGVLD